MRILTEDHSLVWEKVKKTLGRYTPEEARLSGESNIILRCLGHDHHHEVPDITGPIYFSGGDILLVCSDGLNSMLSDFQIEKSIDPKISLADNCNHLIGSANKAGGRDNITVILSTFIDSIGSDPKIQFQKEASTSSHLPSLSNYKQNLNKKTSKSILLITVIFLISILGIFSIIHFQKEIPNDQIGSPT
ncbi:MAG: hypothetical protein IPN15_03785 [Saprospiraceae bacterium]|nr:hypothetical protein [Candidatus Vicinibacter affinis]